MRRNKFFGWVSAFAIPLFAVALIVLLSLSISCGRKAPRSDNAEMMPYEYGMEEKAGGNTPSMSDVARTAAPPPATPSPQSDFSIRESSLDWLAVPVAAQSEAMLVYMADLQVKVEDATLAAEDIEAITSKYGGYRTAVNQSGKDDKLVIHIQVKVPSSKLWTLLKEVKALGKVESENVTGEDVGEEYFDLKARKEALDLSLDRLKELLKQSGKLADLLTIEQEVRRIEEQRNQVVGRMKKLENLSSYSTVDVTLMLEPQPDIVEEQKFHWLTKTTFQSAWLSFLAVARGLFHLAIWLVAFSPLLIACLIVVWAVRRKNSRRNKSDS